ncbi:MAG: hypothetical protein ACK6D6_20720 [Planctomyces sp.]|jgi:hypothetical protein
MTAPEDTPKRKPGPSQGAPGSAAPPVADVAEVEDVSSVSIQAAAAETAADDEPVGPVGPVVALLSSAAAVSVYSSMTFHLAMWATALVLLPLFGFDVLEMISFEERPLQAALGDEEVLHDAAFVETADNLNSTNLQSPSTMEQMAKQLQLAENAWLHSSTTDAFAAMNGQQDPGENSSDAGGLLKIPVDGLAVTKGSFTAFTIPANPQPRQAYSIVIEVKLPDDVKKYRVSDLSGKVKGTDGYEQKLPYDTRTPGASGYPVPGGGIKRLETSTTLDVVKNKVQIVIRVPGGARLVKDVITIRSRRLKEDQELELIFGQARE